jgi:hypothetical protein
VEITLGDELVAFLKMKSVPSAAAKRQPEDAAMKSATHQRHAQRTAAILSAFIASGMASPEIPIFTSCNIPMNAPGHQSSMSAVHQLD